MAKWLTKANDDVLSFCTCEHPLASLPGQLDCPWCGCGYLLTCSFCRKAFVFGRVIDVDRSTTDLVTADRLRGDYDVAEADLAADAELIADLLAPFDLGDLVVYLDGCFFRSDERDVRFEGLFARHDLLVLPHELARAGVASLEETVGRTDYWFDRELTSAD